MWNEIKDIWRGVGLPWLLMGAFTGAVYVLINPPFKEEKRHTCDCTCIIEERDSQ